MQRGSLASAGTTGEVRPAGVTDQLLIRWLTRPGAGGREYRILTGLASETEPGSLGSFESPAISPVDLAERG